MYKFESSVLINRSQQDVFDFMNNPANSTQWQSGAQYGQWTSSGPHGVGSRFKSGIKFLGRTIEAELEITGWDPPKLSRIKTISGPVPFESTNRLEPQGDGTLLSSSFQIDVGNFFKLAEGLVGKQLEKTVESDHYTLKLLLESGEV